jgi:hypothetical protein
MGWIASRRGYTAAHLAPGGAGPISQERDGTHFGSALGGSPGAEYNEAIASGHYYLQQEWSNANSGCVQRY